MKNSILVLVMAPFFVFSQSKKESFDIGLSALQVPEDLKKNAHAVFRLDEGIVDVSAPGKYTYKVHKVVTILNKDGAGYLNHAFGIDKFRKVDDIEIKIFSQLGVELARYKKKDFVVSAAYDGVSFITDDKVMRLRSAGADYPFTMEVKYTLEYSSYINLPTWAFQTPGVAVEHSRFIVKIPSEIDIRYKTKNIDVRRPEC